MKNSKSYASFLPFQVQEIFRKLDESGDRAIDLEEFKVRFKKRFYDFILRLVAGCQGFDDGHWVKQFTNGFREIVAERERER